MATQISTRLLRTGLGLSLAVLVSVACQSTTGGTGDSRGDFGTEATPTDPGLGDRGGMGAGTTTGRALDGGLRTIYFDFDDHSLRPEARDTLRHNAAVLAQNANARLEIQGIARLRDPLGPALLLRGSHHGSYPIPSSLRGPGARAKPAAARHRVATAACQGAEAGVRRVRVREV